MDERQTRSFATGRSRPAIDRRNTYAQVVDDIVGLVKEGTLVPGSPLSEKEMTESYGIGRSSAREALRVLEAQGLIVADVRTGFVIADPITALNGSIERLLDLHRGTVRDVYEVRRMIEVETAALAATRRTDAELSAMLATIEQQTQVGDCNVEAMMHADIRFHMIIATASRNPLALTIMEGLQGLMRRAQMAVGNIAGVAETSLREHRFIYEAIAAQASRSARTAMGEHLERVEKDAASILDRPALQPGH